MKKQIVKLISVMLACIFVLAAMLPAVTAFAAFVNETVAAADEADPEPPADTEEEEDDMANLSPIKVFLIGILENILDFFSDGKGAGGSSSLISRALNALIVWLKK